jgi:hypothetical protein
VETRLEFKDEAALIEHLRGVDVPCVGCGYSMRGLGGLTCPECGRRFRADDLGKAPRAWWLVFLLGGWGWLACCAVTALAFVWEAALGEMGMPRWYAYLFLGRNGSPLVPTILIATLFAWFGVRVWGRKAGVIEPVLVLAWALAAVHVAALVVVSLF